MSTLTQKVVSCIAGAALVLGGLAGCAGAAAEPKTADEVVRRFTADKNAENYHMDLTYDITMGILGQDVPLNMTYAMDTAGDNAHGTLSADILGQKMTGELYIEKDGKQYAQYQSIGTGQDAEWTKTTTESNTVAASAMASEEALKNGKFEKTDDGYKVTTDGSTFVESSDSMKQMLGSTVDATALQDALKDSTVTYLFDKDCMLKSIDFLADITTKAVEGVDMDVRIKLAVKATISGYGTIDAKTLVVPDNVKANATDYNALGTQLTQLVGGDEAQGTAETPATTTAETPATTTAQTPATTTAQTPATSATTEAPATTAAAA